VSRTRHATHGPRPAGTISRPTAPAGAYLTDGVFLFRVVDLVASGVGEMVDLEDCYWLDVVRVPLTDLRARQLRVVSAIRYQRSEV
jgi:hypothetical protein